MSDTTPEDQLVWSYFGRKTAGFFVDVGANHPSLLSQTWLLEQNGWRGILIEPQAHLCALLRQERKNSIVCQAACSSPEKAGEMLLHVPAGGGGFATLEKNVDDLELQYDHSEKVSVVTLDSILAQAGHPQIDLLSVDVEGTELDVLRGLNFGRYRPKLILLEDKVQSLRKHRFLAARGYKLVKRTGLNNWYIPAEHPFANATLAERYELFRKMYLGLPFRKFHRLRLALRRKRP
ncbi:MAG: FkbM family methyltransferase [Verrucomicrobiota bacterium]|jgi:FkbM family methyltransferase